MYVKRGVCGGTGSDQIGKSDHGENDADNDEAGEDDNDADEGILKSGSGAGNFFRVASREEIVPSGREKVEKEKEAS
mgnify:CR=1 FL=1